MDTGSHLWGPPTLADTSTSPEFADAKEVRRRFGLTRSYLYTLKDEGLIASSCWRRRGAKRGRRLFCCDSIREFLRRNIEAPKTDRRPSRTAARKGARRSRGAK